MNKAIAHQVILLLLAGTVVAGVTTYKIYTTVKTTQEVGKELECLNTQRDYCFQWSNLGFEPSSRPPWWDPDCGGIPSLDFCKSLLGPGPSGVTTIANSLICQTADDNDLCDGLDIAYPNDDDYREACCTNFLLCC